MDITGISESHGVAAASAVRGAVRRPSRKQDFQEETIAPSTDRVSISAAGKQLAAEYQAQKSTELQNAEAGQTEAAANNRYARRASLLPENATKLLALEKRLSEEIAMGENTFGTTLKISYIEQVGDKKVLTDAELEGVALKADATAVKKAAAEKVVVEKAVNVASVTTQGQQSQLAQQAAANSAAEQQSQHQSGHQSVAMRQFQSRLKQIVTMPAQPSSIAA